MKNFRILSLSLAVLAFVGLYSCNTGTKEVKEEVKEVVVEEEVVETVVDTVAVEVVDTVAVEAEEPKTEE